ncbi:unnamed protein product [Strongylus vulgaris]|uniref:Uncharacterized protein n=1 Tax=Strongylus vulgaris TaxID=40348 RepID=A0A3P7M0M8_STRVU|nr:unnamed protein product [Strongylus vulgaris]
MPMIHGALRNNNRDKWFESSISPTVAVLTAVTEGVTIALLA